MSLEVVGSEDTRADGGNGPLARLQAEHARQLAALTEARHYVVDLARRRGLDEAVCIEALDSLLSIVQVVDDDLLETGRVEAQARIRDPEDWPTLALSLQLECAVWTEDQDFFGTGVATWTCATVERFLGP